MYNFDFLFAALAFIFFTWMHYRKVPTLKDTNRKIFIAYLIVGISDIILDIISSYIISLCNPKYNLIGVIVTTFLYIFQAILVFCMLIYGISLRDIPQYKIYKEIKTWTICPICMIIAILMNLYFGQFFYFDSLGNYIHGPAYLAMYVYAGLMCLYLGIENVIYRKEIDQSKRAVIWELLIIVMVCVVLQAVNSNILLTGFGIGLGLVLLMLTLNNPYSQTDNLTGKLDQNAMIYYLNDYIEREKKFHIISLHIFQLRQINNIFGTRAGDDFILYIIKQLDEFIKEPIFRFSGKRFVILFDDCDRYNIAKDKINTFFKNDAYMNDAMISFPIMACSVESANKLGSSDSILGYLDFLFGKVKDIKEFAMIDSVKETIQGYTYTKEVERFIPEAIEKKQFEVYYQPIFDVKEQRYATVEALSRLFHPTLGYISPDVFIEVAQRNKVISDIDTLQFESVCQFINENRFLLSQLNNIKFNLSPSDVIKPNFCKERIQTIEKYNLPPNFFQFEITETLATIYSEELYKDIKELMDAGIEICMDDFGSGYANLSAVLKLPFQSIKIDRSLLVGIDADNKKRALYKSIVDGLKNMGLKIISEGIESESEYSLLKSWGVDMIQGYYFSKPLNGNDLLEKLKNNTK